MNIFVVIDKVRFSVQLTMSFLHYAIDTLRTIHPAIIIVQLYRFDLGFTCCC